MYVTFGYVKLSSNFILFQHLSTLNSESNVKGKNILHFNFNSSMFCICILKSKIKMYLNFVRIIYDVWNVLNIF